MARKEQKEESAPGCPAWLATYGDMVTLVLTFFVLLYSFSTVDAAKWQRLVQAFTGVSVFDLAPPDISISNEQDNSIIPMDYTVVVRQGGPWDALIEAVSEYADEAGGSVSVEFSDFEIVIRFSDSILFDSGRADLKPEAEPILGDLMITLKDYEEELSTIRIEGHTDNLPINTPRFPDNWRLSSERSYAVMDYLADHDASIDRALFCLAGYGEERPIADNDTDEGRAQNRRVDIVLVRPYLSSET